MNISAPEKLAQPILTAEAVRKTLPHVCLKDDGSPKAEKSIQNILSGFNQMLKVGLLDESRLAEQMESEFELTKEAVKKHEAVHGKKSWPSFLNDVRAAANEIINFDTSDMTFAHTLTVLSAKEFGVHLSKTQLSKSLNHIEPGVAACTYYLWMTGKKIPRIKRSIDAVFSLDSKLCANGSLSNKVKRNLVVRPEKDDDKDKEISFILPLSLEKEMNKYIDFRVNKIIPKEMSYLKYHAKPVSLPEKRVLRQLKKTSTKKWNEGTAASLPGSFRFFAKYVKEIHPEHFESISFSTFFNPEILEKLEDYIIDNGTIALGLKLLSWIRSECKRNTYVSNYLYSEDELCNDYYKWVEELSLLCADLKDVQESLDEHYEVISGARNVAWILDSKNPVEYLKTICKGLWDEAEFSATPIGPTAAAMIFDLLLPCPIRAKNTSDLRWLGKLSSPEIRHLHRTETCALYFDKDKQRYTVFVHKKKLKNHKSKSIESIIQPIDHLSEKIEQYLSVRDKHLKKRGWVTDILFPLMKIAANIKKERLDKSGNIIDFRIYPDGIWSLLSEHTKGVINTFFPEENIENGINPHGMRHLAASLFLRDFPENYTALATLLMDNLETVTRIYAKRDDVGNHQKIANWAEGLMNAA